MKEVLRLAWFEIGSRGLPGTRFLSPDAEHYAKLAN